MLQQCLSTGTLLSCTVHNPYEQCTPVCSRAAEGSRSATLKPAAQSPDTGAVAAGLLQRSAGPEQACSSPGCSRPAHAPRHPVSVALLFVHSNAVLQLSMLRPMLASEPLSLLYSAQGACCRAYEQHDDGANSNGACLWTTISNCSHAGQQCACSWGAEPGICAAVLKWLGFQTAVLHDQLSINPCMTSASRCCLSAFCHAPTLRLMCCAVLGTWTLPKHSPAESSLLYSSHVYAHAHSTTHGVCGVLIWAPSGQHEQHEQCQCLFNFWTRHEEAQRGISQTQGENV